MSSAEAVFLLNAKGNLSSEAREASSAVKALGSDAARTRLRLVEMADAAEHTTKAGRGMADMLDRVSPAAANTLRGLTDVTDGFEAVSKVIMGGGGAGVALAGGAGALALVGVGMAALGAMTVSIARDLDGFADSVADLGVVHEGVAEQIRSSTALRGLGEELTGLEVAGKKFAATLGEALAPQMTETIDTMTSMLTLTERLIGALGLIAAGARGAAFVFTGGFSEAIWQSINLIQMLIDKMEGLYNRYLANSDLAMWLGLEQRAGGGLAPVTTFDPGEGGEMAPIGRREETAPKGRSSAAAKADADAARTRAELLAWNEKEIKAREASVEASEAWDQMIADLAASAEAAASALDGVGGASGQDMIDARGQALGGIVGGIESVLEEGLTGVLGAALGPVGAAVGAALDLIPRLDGLLRGLFDEAYATIANLPGEIGNILENTIPALIGRLPDIANAVMSLPIALPMAIMKAIPALLASLITLIPNMIAEFLTAVPAMVKYLWETFPSVLVDALKQAWESIKDSIAAMFSPLKNKEGQFLGTDFRAEKGDKRLFGMRLPFFDTGGDVARTGLAVVHQGERVLTRDEVQGKSSGGSGMSIHGGITVVAPDPRRFAQRLRESLGDYGIGLSLDPMVG